VRYPGRGTPPEDPFEHCMNGESTITDKVRECDVVSPPERRNETLDRKAIENCWPLAREGVPLVLGGCLLTAVCAYTRMPWLALVIGLLTAFTALFFRDPDRRSDAPSHAVLTPADGRVIRVRHMSEQESPLNGPATQISIFMSIFNVHVNRIPTSGVIEAVRHRRGKFFSAHLDRASIQNEQNALTLRTADDKEIVFVQVAGLIARRIACWVRQGDSVIRGQRFGLIRFGSRLDVYLPAEYRVTARPGQKVKAGISVVGYLS